MFNKMVFLTFSLGSGSFLRSMTVCDHRDSTSHLDVPKEMLVRTRLKPMKNFHDYITTCQYLNVIFQNCELCDPENLPKVPDVNGSFSSSDPNNHPPIPEANDHSTTSCEKWMESVLSNMDDVLKYHCKQAQVYNEYRLKTLGKKIKWGPEVQNYNEKLFIEPGQNKITGNGLIYSMAEDGTLSVSRSSDAEARAKVNAQTLFKPTPKKTFEVSTEAGWRIFSRYPGDLTESEKDCDNDYAAWIDGIEGLEKEIFASLQNRLFSFEDRISVFDCLPHFSSKMPLMFYNAEEAEEGRGAFPLNLYEMKEFQFEEEAPWLHCKNGVSHQLEGIYVSITFDIQQDLLCATTTIDFEPTTVFLEKDSDHVIVLKNSSKIISQNVN